MGNERYPFQFKIEEIAIVVPSNRERVMVAGRRKHPTATKDQRENAAQSSCEAVLRRNRDGTLWLPEPYPDDRRDMTEPDCVAALTEATFPVFWFYFEKRLLDEFGGDEGGGLPRRPKGGGPQAPSEQSADGPERLPKPRIYDAPLKDRITVDPNSVDPAASVSQREVLDALLTCVSELPPEERDALALRYWADQTYLEIGLTQRACESTVMRRLRRAQDRLRERLTDLFPPGGPEVDFGA